MKTSISTILIGLATAALTIVFVSCSDLKDDLPPASPSAKAHPAGWVTESDTAHFHGVALKNLGYDLTSCQKCHGQSLTGGASRRACSLCHGTTYPHPAYWGDDANANFHGAYLKAKSYNAAECQPCHGTDYRGAGDAGKSCYQCHASYPHGSGWTDVASGNSHGQFLKTVSWNKTECTSCHGSTFAGGSSGESCFTCHATYPHAAGIQTAHPASLRAANYPLTQCQSCHGASYTGGTIVNVSCSSSGCHQDLNNAAKSPEACSTCHGDFRALASNFTAAAPPKSIVGDTARTVAGVGAHQIHLSPVIGKAVKCAECHTVPGSTFDAGHLGTDLRAEVVFNDTLASLRTNGGAVVPAPSYNTASFTCGNTYCHGYFKNGNQTNAIVWTATEAACGTCHGNPATGNPTPVTGHPSGSSIDNCQNCHSVSGGSPVATLNAGTWTITNAARHVNGKLNLFNNENPF